MSSSQQPLRQSGIYRNLPTFGSEVQGLKAIVCGASGISGFHTIRALLDTTSRWTKVYSLCRSPLSEKFLGFFTDQQRSRLQHVSIDLGSSAEDIAQALQDANVDAEYVFYYAYLKPKSQKSAMDPIMAEELVKANVSPFENFLDSLPLAGIKPKRILLQTGGKNYGVHIGRVRTPLVESDPQPRHLEPNFYYPQEDKLKAFCAEHPETSWNVVRPASINGSCENASMNTFLSFGVYAAVQAYKGEPLTFAAGIESWQFEHCHSTARLTGYLSEWAVLEEKCANQSFNAQDGGFLTWDRFFHEMARWFGVTEVRGPELEEHKLRSMLLKGGTEAPLGYGPPIGTKVTSQLMDWAAEDSNRKVWEQMMKESNGQLTKNPWDRDLQDFGMGDFAYLPSSSLSISKVRRFGFCGFVDTLESIFETFQEFEEMGLLPPMKVDAARPLI